MSGVQRYVSTRLLPSADGWNISGAAHTYVAASDYDKLRERVAVLEAQCEGESIVCGAYRDERDALRTELSALKAQEPVAYGRWAEGLPKGTRLLRYDDRPLVDYKPSESFDVPLYAAPVASKDTQQEVVMPDDKTVERVMADVCEENKEFEMGIPYYALCVHEFKEVVARLNGGKPNE